MDRKNNTGKKKPETKRSVVKGIRMTEAEAAIIHEEAKEEHLSEGAWMRIKLFDRNYDYIPFEIRSAFSRCLYDINKAGVNTNTVARDCHRHKSVDAYDVHRLQMSVDEIKKVLMETYECVKGVVQSGSDKTPPD